MKYKKAAAVVLGAAIITSGCGTAGAAGLNITDVKRASEAKEQPIEKLSLYQEQVRNFAFSSARQIDKSSYIYSPLSLYLALGCLTNGASGQTLEELNKAIAGDKLTLDDVNQYSGAFIDEILKTENLNFDINTLLAMSNEYKMDKNFAQKAIDGYNGSTATVDFSDDNAKKELNDWASMMTDGQIKEIAGDEVNEQTVMVLLNAVYYSGSWTEKFDKELTDKAVFHGKEGETQVDMMHLNSEELHYAENELFQSVSLNYQDNISSLQIFLPNEENTTDDVLAYLEDTERDEYRTRQWQGELALPKFTMETEMDLEELLKGINLPSMFKGGLTQIVEGGKNEEYVNAAKQKAKLIIDEEGTKAAAVTEIGIMETAILLPEEPFKMTVDRPFVYVLEINNLPAFVGVVSDL